MGVHLSKELREKHGSRNTPVRSGDKVKVLCGKFKGKEGKVEGINLKQGKVTITGLEHIKKDGNKVAAAFEPSNLMIVVLDLSDKKRKIKAKRKEDAEKKVVAEKKEQSNKVTSSSAKPTETKKEVKETKVEKKVEEKKTEGKKE